MRGLIACFTIVCLSFASGAPTDAESKMYSKYFDYDDKDIIYSYMPFSKDDMVYAVCEGRHADKKCKVYMDQSVNEDKNTVQSCDLNLNYTRMFDFDIDLFNAGNSKAVFAVRYGDSELKLISVNMKGCHIKEAVIDWEKPNPEHPKKILYVNFIPRESNYDIVYENNELCHDFFCKVTLDYEGNVIKPASKFLVNNDTHFSILQFETTNNGYLVSQNHYYANIFLVQDEDVTSPSLLFHVPSQVYVVGLSTAENKLGFCVQNYGEHKLVCKQYDADGKNKKLDFEMSNPNIIERYLDVYNLEKGLLVLMTEEPFDSNVTECSVRPQKVFVMHVDESGRQGKKVEIAVKCGKLQKLDLVPTLYKNSNAQYCVSSVCLQSLDPGCKESKFSRHTRCLFESELF